MSVELYQYHVTETIFDSNQLLHLYWPKCHAPSLQLPLFVGKVAAGFPSSADDYIDKSLDLNELLIQKPAATFFVRAQGDSMLGAGFILMIFW